MAPKWRFISLALIFILPLGVTFLSRDVSTAPNSVELVCELGNITTVLQDHHPNNNIVLPVYLTNVSDSIYGFSIVIASYDPELLRFRVASQQDTVIYAKFDTVGTRCGGFKFFSARITDGTLHSQVRVSGICDPDSPRVVRPIPPGSGVLLKLIMETTDADSVCALMRTHSVVLHIDRASGSTSFSNPASQTIGCNYVLETDTTYGCCKTWNSNFTVCLEYWPPEHMCITERLRCASIDTLRRMLIDGSNQFLCAPPCQCGDANSDGTVDISDVVFLISHIFSGGAAPATCIYAKGHGDANGDGTVDISDAVFLINRIFSGGLAPHCQGAGF
jgi:hypothetical protein